jgi:signal peptidase II
MSGDARAGWRLGAILAVAAVILDQVSKIYVMDVLHLAQRGGAITIAPVLDLSFVPNPGISYGLLPQNSELGRWILIGLAFVAVVFIGIWLLRTKSRLTAAALGLIAGGALGNAIDRVRYGAVIDFLHLHGGAVPWLDFPYLFNIADACISLGVALLLVESVFGHKAALEQRHETS